MMMMSMCARFLFSRWFSSYFFIYRRKGWTSFQLKCSLCERFSMYNLSAYTRAINSSESSIRPCVPINNMYIHIDRWLIKHPGVAAAASSLTMDTDERRRRCCLLFIAPTERQLRFASSRRTPKQPRQKSKKTRRRNPWYLATSTGFCRTCQS